ncbi:MAG: hypothetical protein ACTH2U_08745 [Brevibacterium sp.]
MLRTTVRALIAMTTLALLALTGCAFLAEEREFPAEQPLEVRQSLDVCALVPTAEVRERLPGDIPVGNGRIVIALDQCWFTMPAGAFWITLADQRDDLPEWVREVDEEEATTSQVEGGEVISSNAGGSTRCSIHAVSESGLILSVHYNLPGAVTDEWCDFFASFAELALGTLAAEIPQVAWTDDSPARVDLCASARDNGLHDRLGVADKDEAIHDDHRDCEVQYEGDASPFHGARVRLGVYSDFEETDRAAATEVAGHEALLRDQPGTNCELSVGMGTDPVLQKYAGKKTKYAVVVEAYPAEGVECSELLTAVEPLIADWPQ